jgi:hypothetical protein
VAVASSIVRRLLLLGRLFYGLLRCCFLRCHQISTPLRCQNVTQHVWYSRVRATSTILFSRFLRRSARELRFRKPASAHERKGLFVSQQWRPSERGHNRYNPSMPLAPINRRTNSTRGPFVSLSELWASRRDPLSRGAGW